MQQWTQGRGDETRPALGQFAQGRRFRLACWALVLLAASWNGGLIIQYGAGMIAREEPVPLSRLVSNQFRRVPQFVWTRGPGLLLNKYSIEEQ